MRPLQPTRRRRGPSAIWIAFAVALGGAPPLAPSSVFAENGIITFDVLQATDSGRHARRATGSWISVSSFVSQPDTGRVKAPNRGIEISDFEEKAAPRGLDAITLPEQGSPIGRLLQIIAVAESASAGYDAVHGGATIRPPSSPQQLTLAEIIRWIEDTPGQFHAIGRYQIIPDTLADLITRTGVSLRERFDAKLQDRFAVLLIEDAGYREFRSGTLSLKDFMDNLALIWAGLPLESGKSAYDGFAGNQATLTRAAYHEAMSGVFTSSDEGFVTTE